jgi:LEA14-like dessication related protein
LFPTRALLLGITVFAVIACSKPTPPTLTPIRAVVTEVSPAGLGIELTLQAKNPNSIDLTAGGVKAHAVLDKHIEVGVASVDQRVTLAANQTTELNVALSIPWADVVSLLALNVDPRPSVPYFVEGTLTLGGDLLAVEVPFGLEGSVSHDQIVRATLNSLPFLPGVTAPRPPPSTSIVPRLDRRHQPRDL